MSTKLDFGMPLYSNNFRYCKSAFFLSSLSLFSCVASYTSWPDADLSLKGLHTFRSSQ